MTSLAISIIDNSKHPYYIICEQIKLSGYALQIKKQEIFFKTIEGNCFNFL